MCAAVKYELKLYDAIVILGEAIGSNVDRRGVLNERIFTFRVSKDNKVFISWRGKQVTVLSGKKADEFVARIASAQGKEAQLIMAKATGNFKRGNEKRGV